MKIDTDRPSFWFGAFLGAAAALIVMVVALLVFAWSNLI